MAQAVLKYLRANKLTVNAFGGNWLQCRGVSSWWSPCGHVARHHCAP